MSSYVQKMRHDYLAYLGLDEKQRAQTRPPDRHLPPDKSLSAALSELFAGNCAFCETRDKLSVYRFRPTSEALPLANTTDSYMAYGWLADVWQNLYPICDDCRRGQLNYFPVKGNRSSTPEPKQYERFIEDGRGWWPFDLEEECLFLDPCLDRDLHEHLTLLSDGQMQGKSDRGELTIAQFRLNRPSLISKRAAALTDRSSEIESFLSGSSSEAAEAFDASSINEFSGALRLFIRDQMMRRETSSFESTSDTLEPGSRKTQRPGSAPVGAGVRRKAAPGKTAGKPATARAPGSAPGLSPMSPQRKAAIEAQLTEAVEWRLKRIEVKAFKSLEHLSLDMPKPVKLLTGKEQTPILLILGENASGKSSILEAIALTMISDQARDSLDEPASKLLLNPVFMGDQMSPPRKEGSITLTFADPDGQERQRGLKLTPEGFTSSGELPPGLPIFAYGAYRHYRNDFRRWSAGRGVVSLFKSDNLLSNPEKWLLKLEERDFEMVVRTLREIFGIGDNFKEIERDRAAKRCMIVTQVDENVFMKTPLSSVSSGFRTILALTCDIMRWLMDKSRDWDFPTLDTARGIVLIDEVEAHLHPRWKVRIMEGLRKAMPGITFIVTTHDPLCLRGMNEGEVMVLHRTPGEAAGSDLPVMVESLAKLPDVAKLTIEQLLTSDLFNLFDTDDQAGGKTMAELADSLVRAKSATIDASSEDGKLLMKFRREIEEALPVGNTEVSRLVQEAVSTYVINQGKVKNADRIKLRASTRRKILSALERY